MSMPFEPVALGAGAAALAAGGFAYAGRLPSSQLFGSTLLGGSDWRELALTFDDGPNERYTQELIEYLALYKVRATFFMLGDHVRQLPALAREVHAAGHVVGNHTMNHPNLMYQGSARIRQQLADCNRLLEDTLGAPVRYFRPPYGSRRPEVLRVARELGLEPVLWTAAGYDWWKITPEQIYSNLRRGIRRRRRSGRGSTLLLHDGGPGPGRANRSRTVTVVPMVIYRMRMEEYRFVTVDAWATRTEGKG